MVNIDSSDWIRKIVLERELADITSKSQQPVKELKSFKESQDVNEEFIRNNYVCEYIREELKKMEDKF